MCDDEVKEDPREKIFPNWYDLSIKYEGYETKGTFGTFHVVNTHESQRPFVIKLLPSVAKPTEEDPFICESLDVQEDEDFEWVKVPKKKDDTKKKDADDKAPKRLTKVKYIDPLSDFQAGQAQLVRRLQILKAIKSKSVMTFRGYQEVDGNLWYMSNYIKQRSCLDYAHAMGRNLKEDECCNLSIGVLRALAYCRFRRIVHGNIKPSNVFFDPETGLGVLGDFRMPGIQMFDDLAKPGVSLHYMSPELLLSKGELASPKSDLWAWACSICQLMTRLPPHNEMDRAELEAEYSKKPFPPRPQLPRLALDFCKDFLATCFTEPKKRPTAELLQAHPWVAGDLSPGLSHIELSGTLLSDWQNRNLIGVYAPDDAKIPGADLKRPVYKHYANRVYIFYFESTASWQVAEMKDLGRPRAVLYAQDDVRWPQLIGKNFKGWSKEKQNWVEIEDVSIDVFYVAQEDD